MNHELETKATLFVNNVHAIKGEFIWKGHLIKRLSGLIYALENKPVDCGSIQKCLDYIKENTTLFSLFRGDMSLVIATLLSLRASVAQDFSNTLDVYDLLKTEKLRSSDYLVVAAYQIATQSSTDRYPLIVQRTKAFYEGMKKNHWFLTSQDDYIYAAMLALSDTAVDSGIQCIEGIYQRLKPAFWSGNSVQALSQILVLGGQNDATTERILEFKNTLKANHIRLDKEYTLPSLGILTLLTNDAETLAKDIIDVQQYLRQQKGFGVFSMDSQELLLYCATIVSSCYVQSLNSNIITASVTTSLTNLMIAQQAAMIAAMSASSAAASSASHS